MGPAIVVRKFDESDIELLLKIENESRLKIFPRYIVYDPLYTAIDHFCWIYHIRLDFHKNIDLPIPTIDLYTNTSKYEMSKKYEFLQVLEIAHERDILDDDTPAARVMCKLALTSETAIMVAFLVMNPEKWLKSLLFYLFSILQMFFVHSSRLMALRTVRLIN